MLARAPRAEYLAAAIVLHWAIAAAIFAMIPIGWWMADAIKEPATQAQAFATFQLHKSIGLTVLLLSLARLALRVIYPPPPPPEGMPRWQRMAAHATHVAFYVVMIALPLTGWVYVSTGFTQSGEALRVPTSYFGLFEWPHLPIANAPEEVRRNAAAGAMSAHSALAWGAILLAVAHVGAALKHHFVDKDDVLARMVPGLRAKPANMSRRFILGLGFGMLLAAAIGIGPMATSTRRAAEVPEAPAAEAALAEAPAAAEPAPQNPTQSAPAATPAPTAAAPAAPAAAPAAWALDMANSEVGFAGTHAGAAFAGRFTRWSADISFAPDALAQSRAVVTFETASARTGDPTRDGALPGAEWFDVKAHPTARFEAQRFRALGGNRFEALGQLTIKGRASAVTLPFTYEETGGRARVSGRLRLDRIALGLGLESDPNAEWVSREIEVRLDLVATRR